MKESYWYHTVYEECPVCGKGKVIKIRMYSPKPENAEDRCVYKQVYDYCMEK